jgi:GYF domain 2
LWAVDFPDGQDRELTAAEVKKEFASGVINETTLVWREGMDEWKELGQVPELLTPPPAPKPAAPEVPPQRAKALSAPLLDASAQRPRAPSSPGLLEPFAQRPRAASSPGLPEPAAQWPRAPSSPVIPEPPAQRPKAPSTPALPPPAPILKTPPPFSPFDPPKQPTPPAFPAASPPIAGRTPPAFPASPAPAPIPATAASFASFGALGPSQPLVPQPLPQPPIAALPQRGAVDEWPQPKSRMPLIIGIVVAILVVGGAVFFLTNSSSSAPPPPAPISALPPTTPTPSHASEARATDTNPAPDNTGTTEGSAPHGALDPPSAGPAATPNAGFAELFANGARHADEKRGVNGPTQRFDATAAKAALASAAVATASCREKGGPAGKATIVVTFEPSGNVSSATVSDAPFAGTSSGACIASAMKRATVPPFSGLPGTVTKTISIQ